MRTNEFRDERKHTVSVHIFEHPTMLDRTYYTLRTAKRNLQEELDGVHSRGLSETARRRNSSIRSRSLVTRNVD